MWPPIESGEARPTYGRAANHLPQKTPDGPQRRIPKSDVPTVVLANLVLGENVFPEMLQEQCEPELLAAEMELLLKNTPERARQLAALEKIPQRLALAHGAPSDAAAEVVLHYAKHGRHSAQ